MRAELWARYWWEGMRYHFRRAPSPEDLDRLAERCCRLELRLHEVHFRFLAALVRFDLGQAARAQDEMREVRSLCRRRGLVRLRFCGAFALGAALEVKDALDEAIACYEDAVAGFENFGDRRNAALAKVFLAGASGRHGDVDRSRRLLHAATHDLAASGDARAAELVELQRGRVSVAQIRRTVGPSGSGTAAATLGEAEDSARRAARLREVGALVRPPLLASSGDARMIVALLHRDIELVATVQTRLVVRPDGSAFALGDHAPQPLPEGDLLRRVFLTLVECPSRTARACGRDRRADRTVLAWGTNAASGRAFAGARSYPPASRGRAREARPDRRTRWLLPRPGVFGPVGSRTARGQHLTLRLTPRPRGRPTESPRVGNHASLRSKHWRSHVEGGLMSVSAHHCDLVEELETRGGAEAQSAKRAEAPEPEEPKPVVEASDVPCEGTDRIR